MANTLKFGNGEWYGKEGTILAYNSENNNYKPLPFTFDRASSATRVNKQGLIETVGADQPRIDYLNDSNGALLLEPSRTNSVTKSENIQDWNRASNATSEFGYEDPFKGNNAVKLTSSSTAQSYQVYQSTTALSSGTTYTFSMYAKKGTGHIFRLDFGIPDNGFVHIDLRDGSLLQESGSTYYDGYSVTPISNGWYRISMTATFNSSAYYRAGLFNQQGDCYVAFAQIEAGSYATSYIPTQGSAVTRLADECNNGGNEQVINSTEGVFYLETSFLENSASATNQLSLSDGSGNNRIMIYPFSNTQLGIRFNANSSQLVSETITVSNLSFNSKIAVRWGNGNYSLYQNGSEVYTQAIASTPIGLFKLNFSSVTETAPFYGNVKDVRVYNTALTDQELQALTQV